MADSRLGTWDFVAVALYFAAVIAAGLISMCRANRGTVSGYFLAGRFMIWLPVGASLFASNIGSEHFIGLAGSGAASGIAVGAFELNACMLLQLLGWVFLPVYIASGVCTLPGYMKKRFGGSRIRVYLTALSLALYIFTKISVNLYSGALFIQQALHWDIYVSVFLLLAITALTTVTGGLAAVIYTDTLQTFVMILGGVILMAISFAKVGGYERLYYDYQTAVSNATLANANSTCGYPRDDAWYMLRDPRHSDMPWPGFLLGQTPASIWYWCADQMMVQRTLAAKSLSHAQGGTLFAGYLKLLPLFLMVMPGMISRVLFPDEVACSDPDICWEVCQNRAGCSNIAYPKLVLELMPTGLKGVMMSVMLAALMSDLTSIFNSASTLFTMDVYKLFRRGAKNKELMIVGRLFVCVMVVISILWIPVVKGMQGGQLYIYIQAISAYLAPPIAAVYCVAILWKRANEKGAFAGLMVGLVVGVIRMVLDFVYIEPHCGEPDLRPTIVAKVHYMYFAMILFFLSIVVMVVISLLTKPPAEKQMHRTTYWTRFDKLDDKEDCYSIVQPKSVELETLGECQGSRCDVSNGAVGDPHEAGGEPRGAEAKAYTNGQLGPKDEENMVMLNGGAAGDAATDVSNVDIQITQSTSRTPSSLLRSIFNWFCGFENEEMTELHTKEMEERLVKVCSLKQDPRAKKGLLAALLLLCATNIFLFIFFSTGSSFGLL